MKNLWNNFKVAFAMFSKIPMPRADWTKENMKYFLCFFPWVGAVIAGLTAGLFYLSGTFYFQRSFLAVLMILISVLVTGGIHIDGLLDTSDALSSWQERERRLEILKDSHAGAFAVIAACTWFVCMYGSISQFVFEEESVLVFACGYMVSRSFSGLGVLILPKAKEGGTVAEFSRKSENKISAAVLALYLLILAVVMIAIHPLKGAAAFITAAAVFAYYRHMALKYFGGTTGDLSGWFLCVCEAAMALVLALVNVIFG